MKYNFGMDAMKYIAKEHIWRSIPFPAEMVHIAHLHVHHELSIINLYRIYKSVFSHTYTGEICGCNPHCIFGPGQYGTKYNIFFVLDVHCT
jgi:hypothetical protein